VRLLARHGVMTLVELHQDQWGARYLGEGLPGWMTLDDGIAAGPRQRSPRGYLSNPALAQAFKSFWANRRAPGDVGLMDRWTQVAGAVARALAHEHSLLGYDLMNAPWSGPRWDCGAGDGCPGFQRGALARLWRRTVAQVRAVDPDAITWIEPPSLVPISGPLVLPATGDARRSGLAFQADCGVAGFAAVQPEKRRCGGLTAAAIDRAAAWSQAADRPSLLVGDAATPAGVSRIGLRKIADARMQSWLRWPYANVPARPSDTTPLIWDQRAPATGTNVNTDYLVFAGTPYPRVIAGTPISWSTNRDTTEFKATWTTTLPSGRPAPPDAVSEVWLGRLLYSAGYNLTLTGARVVRRSADWVVLQALPGADRVSVTATSAVPFGP
jgi:endoglycosylceramidase